MSPPNLAIREIGFSCRFSFTAPARREAKGQMVYAISVGDLEATA